jgi:hypothetical protein
MSSNRDRTGKFREPFGADEETALYIVILCVFFTALALYATFASRGRAGRIMGRVLLLFMLGVDASLIYAVISDPAAWNRPRPCVQVDGRWSVRRECP